MDKILLIAHTEANGSLSKASLEALTCAKDLAASLSTTFAVGVFGENTAKALEQIGSCGAEKYLSVSGADFKDARYATDSYAVEGIYRKAQASIVIAAGTSRMNRVIPGVAHRVEGVAELHVSSIAGSATELTATRWLYRQRIEAVITRASRPWFLGVDSGNYTAWTGSTSAVTAESVATEAPAACKRSKVVGLESPGSGEQTIKPDAELLMVAGAGWTKKQADGTVHAQEARKTILGFLSKSGASLGGSKAMVDLDSENREAFNFMTHLNQIGQTGTSPRHQKGLSTCCHGEEPHAVGWRFINERRAVNLDANCGWARGKADVLYVADAFAVMAKVNELLSK
ncbi:MAG: electron transfer flavoprotein subunit alpha [Deltaproteobacteria bacterium]|nr:electron transfer flavoprotein subunit alpha [Deltaproteobacteria bacterium]